MLILLGLLQDCQDDSRLDTEISLFNTEILHSVDLNRSAEILGLNGVEV